MRNLAAVANELLDCVCSDLGDMCPCISAVVGAALPPEEWCCDGCSPSDPTRGLLAVWPARSTSDQVSASSARRTHLANCDRVLSRFQILLVRCRPQPNNGVLVPDRWIESVEQTARDHDALWSAVGCCAKRARVVEIRNIATLQCVGLIADVQVEMGRVCC